MDFCLYLYIAPAQVRFITVEENSLVILGGWLLWRTFYLRRILQRSQTMSYLLCVIAKLALTDSNISNFSSKSKEDFFNVELL